MAENMRGRTGTILSAFLGSVAKDALDITDAFLMSAGSTRQLVKNLGMLDREYYSSMQSLRRNGFIRKINEDQFLITPKGIAKAQRFARERIVFNKRDWKGMWILVIFDIPDNKKPQRNSFRSVLKRMGFVGIQKSVFIAPFDGQKQVALIRDELGIAEYVTILKASVSEVDSDLKLRERFDLA
jgi:phenylacetic acid degradation operon negative regulatory protein